MSTESSPEKLSVIVFSGEFERVHYALVMASAAAAIGRPVTLFFTMDGARALLAPADDGAPAWASLAVADGRESAAIADAEFAAKGVATFEELLEACAAFEVKFMVCEMGLRARGWEDAPLRDDVTVEPGGVVSFLNDASSDGAMVFI